MVGLKPPQIACKESPLDLEEVWQIECFLLKIFEYGNYSFRRALFGTYHEDLKCVFYLAYDSDEIIGAAGALFSADRPFSAIFSPVAVEPDFQRRGIATEICGKLLDALKSRGITQVYLAVSQGHPARELYRRLGFSDYTGIVMRKNLCSCDPGNSDKCLNIICQELSWQDYAEVLALLCEPSVFMTFDYHQGLFSSRYEPVKRFLPVFPEMMQRLEKNEGCTKVLKRDGVAEVVGLAQICGLQSKLQRHVAYLDFFAKDGYTNVQCFVKDIILEHKARQECQILTWVPEPDELKKMILENLGARRVAMLPNAIIFANKMYNVEVFQF